MNKGSKIAIVRCMSYDEGAVREAIERAVGLLGGVENFVSPGENILIKPNLLGPHPPDKAVTTHPTVVEAVAKILKSSGAVSSIGDSPAFYPFGRVASACGIDAAAARAGVPLVPFDAETRIATPEGSMMSKITVARAAARADGIISLPKFKTHCLTRITGAVKSVLGCVPGLKKAEMHYRFPDGERFSRMLFDILRALPFRLHIVDAIVGMDGNGPSGGGPFHMNVVIAGADAVAVDSTACRIAGIDPASVPMIRVGAECGWGIEDEKRIEIAGESIESVRLTGFRVLPPKSEVGRLIPMPRWLSKRFRRWLVRRPRIIAKACTRCGACVGICPARPKALSLDEGRVTIDDGPCLLCYCCAEVCPSNAVRLKRGPLAGLLARAVGI